MSEPVGALGRPGPVCPECGRVAEAPDHPFYGVLDSAEYDFDEEAAPQRAEASDLLVRAGISFRWDDGYRLIVSSTDEHVVDVLFGQVAPDGGEEEAASGPASGVDSAEVDRAAVVGDDGAAATADVDDGAAGVIDPDAVGAESGDEPSDWVRDEQSVQAMGALFDASDRLKHQPWNTEAAADLADASAVVRGSPLPFGVNQVLWDTTSRLAGQLIGLINDGADPEDVSSAADDLRAVLRDHV